MPATKSKRKNHSQEPPGRNLRSKKPKFYGEPDSLSDLLEPPTQSSSQGEHWEAKGILAERRVRRRLEYLVDLEGVDPNTNLPYEPDWRPASAISKALLESWLEKKDDDFVASATPSRDQLALQRSGISSPERSGSSTPKSLSAVTNPRFEGQASPEYQTRRGRRPVIEDSTEEHLESESTPSEETVFNRQSRQRAALKSSSPATDGPASGPDTIQPDQQDLFVQVTQHTQSFFDRYEQVPAIPETPAATERISVPSEQSSSQTEIDSGTPLRAVPDSEDSHTGELISTQPLTTLLDCTPQNQAQAGKVQTSLSRSLDEDLSTHLKHHPLSLAASDAETGTGAQVVLEGFEPQPAQRRDFYETSAIDSDEQSLGRLLALQAHPPSSRHSSLEVQEHSASRPDITSELPALGTAPDFGEVKPIGGRQTTNPQLRHGKTQLVDQSVKGDHRSNCRYLPTRPDHVSELALSHLPTALSGWSQGSADALFLSSSICNSPNFLTSTQEPPKDTASGASSTHQVPLPPTWASSSSAPNPPSEYPATLAADPPTRPVTSPSQDMPETRRSTQGPLRRSGSSTPTVRSTQSNMDRTAKARAAKVAKSKRTKQKSERDRPTKESNTSTSEITFGGSSGERKMDDEPQGSDSQDSQSGPIAAVKSTPTGTPLDQSPEPRSPGSFEAHTSSNADGSETAEQLDDARNVVSSVSSDTNDSASPSGGTRRNGDRDYPIAEPYEELQGPPLDRMEFIVPLPLQGQAIDQYKRTIAYHKELVRNFVSGAWSKDSNTLKDIESFIETMRNITTHIDLTNTTIEQNDIGAWEQAQWDKTASSKFKFLFELLDFCRNQPMHFIVLARSKPLRDMLAKSLTGCKINWQRPDEGQKATPGSSLGSVLVTILPPSGLGADAAFPMVNIRAIISFDQVLELEAPHLRRIRQSPAWEKSLAPILYLAVRNSIDHIEHCLFSSLTAEKRLSVLVYCMTELRRVVGRMNNGFTSVTESAAEVGRFILMHPADAEDMWPLGPIGELDDDQVWGLIRAGVALKTVPNTSQELPGGNKRPLERGAETENNAKRMRVTPPENEDKSTSRITDSAVGASSAGHLAEELRELRATVKDLEMRLIMKDAELRKREDSIKEKDAQNNQIENDLEDLQYRFEEQSTENRALTAKIVDLEATVAVAQKTLESKESTISALREDKRRLEQELKTAKSLAATSTVQEVVEVVEVMSENAELKERVKKLEKERRQLAGFQDELHQAYTAASDHASSLTNQINTKDEQIVTLTRRASGIALEVKKMNQDVSTKAYIGEIQRLKAMLANRDQLLKAKDEELKNRRVPMGTRAGSVPRSPRVGATSRAGSPISDKRINNLKIIHNLRDERSESNGINGPESAQRIAAVPRRQSSREFREAKDLRETMRPEPDVTEGSTLASRTSTPIQPRPGSFDPRFVMVNPDPKQPPFERAKPIEPRPLDTRQPELAPAQVRQPELQKPVEPPKSASTVQRPFPCTFAQYSCPAAFTSKNEWKRHIGTKHIQLGFWRCDMCPPSPGIDAPVYNDFNRKDLFTQHLRRMHGGPAVTPGPQQGKESQSSQQSTGQSGEPVTPGTPSNMPALTDDQIAEIQKRCYRQLRLPPPQSSCVFCARTFTGHNSWEERLEHVGGHLERERKNGTGSIDISSWREDPPLRDYLLDEGIISYDQHGRYRIGDGKPRRQNRESCAPGQALTTPLATSPIGEDSAAMEPRFNPGPMHKVAATAPLGGSQQSAVQIDTESEGSSSARQRRRGRPPKRQPAADVETPLKLAVIEDHPMPDMAPGDRELRPKAMEPNFSQPAPSPQFPPMPVLVQPREGVSTRRQEKMLAEAAAARPPLLAPAPQPQLQQPAMHAPLQSLVQVVPPLQMGSPIQFAPSQPALQHPPNIPLPLPGPLPTVQYEAAETPQSDDEKKPARAQGRSFREVIM